MDARTGRSPDRGEGPCDLLDAIFAAVPDGLLVLEPDHTVVDCNEAAAAFLGVARGDAPGRRCFDLCPKWRGAAGDPRADCPLVRVAAGDVPSRGTHRLTVGGAEREIEITVVPLPRPGGGPRYLEVLRDVTDQLRAEEEVRRRGVELEALIHALGHDLKAPLANIRGFADLLIAGSLTAEQTAHFLARIRWNTEVMGRLVTDLLDLMRVGIREEPPGEVDAGEAAREALRVLEPRIAERGAAVEVAPGMPVVRYPASRLPEVFTNLVGNALEHAGGAGGLRVLVSHERAGAMHRFRVTDNGPGVEPAERGRIFEPFYSRTKKKTGSSGLGLAIVRRIVEHAGGTVAVEDAPGGGASFVFTVPA